MLVTAIILAAGRGLRFRSKIDKSLFKLDYQPLLIYSLLTLSRNRAIKNIVLVVNAQNKTKISQLVRKYNIAKATCIVNGGKRRQDSVLNGLKAIDNSTDLILIHDSARPFIDEEIITRIIKQAKKTGAAVAGVPVKATIKEVHSPQSIVHGKKIVKKTLNRENLWEIQTPQVFRRELIIEAYKKYNHIDVTDDAALVEKLGSKVNVVPGSYNNIKITTPEDLLIAQAILKSK